MTKPKLFATEADLVAKFCELIDPANKRNSSVLPNWTAYHETAGWDLLLAHESGAQIGIEAKLSLNPKVLDQALPEHRWSDYIGPDFRAVLVPADGLQHYTSSLAAHLGIVVIAVSSRDGRNGKVTYDFSPALPDLKSNWDRWRWPDWLPAQRCKLPDYIPDVTGGHSAPVALTDWKIRAIKLLIILERRGYVTRRDMKALGISASRWTDNWHGFLAAGEGGYVRCSRTPGLKAQHPTNWAQIEADYETWSKGIETAARIGLEVRA